MDKPITLIIKETRKELEEMINSSPLPLFIIEPMLKEILADVEEANELQYKRDLAEYNKTLKEKQADE